MNQSKNKSIAERIAAAMSPDELREFMQDTFHLSLNAQRRELESRYGISCSIPSWNKFSRKYNNQDDPKPPTTVSKPTATPEPIVREIPSPDESDLDDLRSELIQISGSNPEIPTKRPFVEGELSEALDKILEHDFFSTTYVVGPAGCGKTEAILQAASKANKKVVRTNITGETDEDDLIGGFRLIGSTSGGNRMAWFDGPVTTAMRTGSVLVLDELDLATPKIMCLQPILEGNGIFIKKISTMIEPAPGFKIIATGNTKGNGDEEGRFIGTNFLNDAMLDRFNFWFEKGYDDQTVEGKILRAHVKRLGITQTPEIRNFVGQLTRFSNITRTCAAEGTVDVQLSTRQLVSILKNFLFGFSPADAIRGVLRRWDGNTQATLMEYFNMVLADNETIEGDEAPDEADLEKEEPAPTGA